MYKLVSYGNEFFTNGDDKVATVPRVSYGQVIKDAENAPEAAVESSEEELAKTCAEEQF